jgi:oligosaccharide repeat unit polymerase
VRDFIVLIPVFGAVAILSSTFKFRRILNPLSLVVFWWCFWLWVTNFHLTGLFVPSSKTQVLVLVMVSAIFLGSKLAFAKSRPPAEVAEVNENFRRNSRYLVWLNVLYFPVVAFLLMRALPALLAGHPFKYRAAAFGSLDQPSPLFGGSYPQFLFEILVLPVIFFSLITGLVLYFRFRRKKLLFLSIALLMMEAALMLGRFNIYFILAFAALTYVFVSQRRTRERDIRPEASGRAPRLAPKRIRDFIILGAVLAFGTTLLLSFTVLRGEKSAGLMSTLKKTIVDYHTVGFVLFDEELSSPTSRLNTRLSYGRSIIGGLDKLAVVLLRRLNSGLVPVAGESGMYMAEQREVGKDKKGDPIMGNAFYTVLYSLYFDGRYLTVVLIPLVFGYFLAASYLDWLKNGSLGSLALLILLMYVGLFSLFQSPAEGLRFWVGLMLLALLKRLNLSFLARSPASPKP